MARPTLARPPRAVKSRGAASRPAPGHDNHVVRNRVYTTGGVPPGVFGSSGNTVLEHNCLTTGIQAYAYNGPFLEVTVRYNVIGPGSYVPDTSVIIGWDTNTFTDGSSCDGM